MTDDKPLLSQELGQSLAPVMRRMWMEELARQVAEDEATEHLLCGDDEGDWQIEQPEPLGVSPIAHAAQTARDQVVGTLDTLDRFYSSPESLHLEADRIVLENTAPEIRAAYERLRDRVGFCYEHNP